MKPLQLRTCRAHSCGPQTCVHSAIQLACVAVQFLYHLNQEIQQGALQMSDTEQFVHDNLFVVHVVAPFALHYVLRTYTA
jgi:hypothetical protein